MIVESKESIKKLRNFVQDIKNETVNYDKINEIIKENIDGQVDFYSWHDEQLCCCDVNYNDLYNLIKYVLLLGKRYYTGINTGDSEFSYTNMRGNTSTFNIDVSLRNLSGLFSDKYKHTTVIGYKYDSNFKSSKEGWNNKLDINSYLNLSINGIPFKLPCKSMRFYSSTGDGSNWVHSYVRRSKYHVNFDDVYISAMFDHNDEDENIWLVMVGDNLPHASYLVSKEDLIKACKQTNNIVKVLNKLKSKLVNEDFIVNLNDHIKNLKISTDYFVDSDGNSVKELVFYTNNSIPEITSGLKFITIKMEQNDEYMYRFNGSIGKESLSYNRPIETDEDIKQALDATLGMISYSPVLSKYKDDLLEIKNNL